MLAKILLILPSLLLAEKAAVKVDEIDTHKDTTITIKKGVKNDTLSSAHYEILEGAEDIAGTPEFDKGKARTSWKEACKEWKDNLKELNEANSLISLSCGTSQMVREEDNKVTFKSHGTYKVKVKTKENTTE